MYTLDTLLDQYAENPARDSDGIQILVAHRTESFGTHNFRTAEECDNHLARLPKDKRMLVLPLYAYIHSGTALSLAPFACPWDSGMIGYITVDMGTLGVDTEGAKRVAQSFINEMNDYLGGNVWGYVIEDEEGNQVESCWGYYGNPDESGCKSDGEQALAYLMSQTTVVQ